MPPLVGRISAASVYAPVRLQPPSAKPMKSSTPSKLRAVTPDGSGGVSSHASATSTATVSLVAELPQTRSSSPDA